jgi:Resolvase, N terminal domain
MKGPQKFLEFGGSREDAVRDSLRAEESSLTRRFMISIMSALSELEREVKVERVVAGVKEAQAAGKHRDRPGAFFAGTGSSSWRMPANSGPRSASSLECRVGTFHNALPRGSPNSAVVSV